MANGTEKVNAGERINEFVQKNRKGIVIFFGGLVVLLAGFIGALSIMAAVHNRNIAVAEEFKRRYEALLDDFGNPAFETRGSEIEALLKDMTAFAEKTSGYTGGRVWSLVGDIQAKKKDWPGAETAYAGAAKAAAKTYLAPAAYYNAGAAAEEQGNNERAIEYYTRCVAQASLFPASARAQFAIGRLWEIQENPGAALEAYRSLVTGWSASVWTNLAQSRILVLEAYEKPADTETTDPESGREGDL
jgi:tetratricopeptide (TPR) repeat protein